MSKVAITDMTPVLRCLMAWTLEVVHEYYFGDVSLPLNEDTEAIHADNTSNFYDYNRKDLARITTLLMHYGLVEEYALPPGVRAAVGDEVGKAYRVTVKGQALMELEGMEEL